MNTTELMHQAALATNTLRELSEEETKQLRAVQIEMYKDLRKVCEDNGLTLFFGWGSALGAVRHNGFIPWDDDMDFVMLRSEYDKLKVLLENGALGDKYEFNAPLTSRPSKNMFMKIYLKGTELSEITDLNIPFPKGIFIDIFPIENVPEGKASRSIQAFLVNLTGQIAGCSFYWNFRSEELKKFMSATPEGKNRWKLTMILGALSSFISHRKWVNLHERILRRIRPTGIVAMSSSNNYCNGRLSSMGMYFPPRKGKFEGMDVDLPNDVDGYLKLCYGKNYMQIPPPEKRMKHFIYRLDFGNINSIQE